MALDLEWPCSIGPSGRERVVEQGSLEEVQQGVDLTFHVPAGHLLHAKDFGRDEYAFAIDPTSAIEQTIKDECERVTAYNPLVNDNGSFSVVVTAVVDPDDDDEVTL